VSESEAALEGKVVLGRYRIVRALARGGMGMVYLGRIEGAAGFSKPVVIKRVLSNLDPSRNARAQFAREARILAGLQHPGIVSVVDFGEEDGAYLMVLEYVHGYHVGHWLKFYRQRGAHLHWEHAVHVAVQVLLALHHAHTRRGPDGRLTPVVHRDVSPGNILVDVEGNVRLVDFGIARADDEAEESRTRDGVVKGKLPYIAPEVYRSVAASPVSDVYAAAVVLYQLLVGKNPFSGPDMSTIIARVLELVPEPPSKERPEIPRALDDVLARGMARSPAARFQSAHEFAAALTMCLTRTEQDVAEDFAATIAQDFSGELAKTLDVDSLATLDAAWRAAAEDPRTVQPLRLSTLPPSSRGSVTAQLDAPAPRVPAFGPPTDALNEQTAVEIAARPREAPSDRAAEGDSQSPPLAAPPPAAAPSPRMGTGTLVLAVLAAGLLAAGATFAVTHLSTPPERPRPARFVVVESKGPTAPAAPALAPASTPPAASGASATPSALASAPTRVGAAPQGDGQGSQAAAGGELGLTRAFARRHAAVERCFDEGLAGLSGSPELTLHFRVRADGSVASVALTPQAIAATPLGGCLLGVARTTAFGPQAEAVAFAIPIQTRSVAR
jgi:serine/threonine-protein kinase